MDSNENQFINDFNENQIFLTENEFPFTENGFPFPTEAMDATTVDDSGQQPTTALTTEPTTSTTPTTGLSLMTPEMATEDPLAVVKTEPEEEALPEEPVVEEFTVESIVGKRKRNNRIEYCVKWLGFDDTENTWEPIDNLNCSELIRNFESRDARQTTTPTTSGRRGRQKKTTPTTETTPKTPSKDGFARGLKAKRVVGVVEESGQLMYSVEWEGQKEAEMVSSKVAKVKIPQLVIAFLQSKLRFNRKRPKEPLENYRPLASKKFSLFNESNRFEGI